MRKTILSVLVVALAGPALAQEQDSELEGCAKVGAVVQAAVEARIVGEPKRKARRMLAKELDRDTGAMLAEFIYTLPEDQLTEEVAETFQAQCEQL